MIDSDNSITNGLLLVITLVGLAVGLSVLKHHVPILEKWLESTPLALVENGNLLQDRMDKVRVDESVILESARSLQGLERLDQIKYAVLERSGDISIIPKQGKK